MIFETFSTKYAIFILAFMVSTATIVFAIDQALEDEEIQARIFINELDEEYDRRRYIETTANWAYASNITDYNEKLKTDISTENANFYKEKAKEINSYNFNVFEDEDLRRRFKKFSKLGYAALPDDKYRNILNAISAMESNYAKIRICSFTNKNKCDLQLEPELTAIMEESTNSDELKYYWTQWYDKAGAPVREYFDTYVALNKEAALMNNYTSGAEEWLDEYEDTTFEQQLENIFDQIRSLYEKLHGYVRHKLQKIYGNAIIKENEPIPMHLLGNMWAQSWESIGKYAMPYEGKTPLDVTPEMIKQNYTEIRLFEMGDEFFQSLNMTKLPKSFWEKSILVKPKDGRDLICHASAWDFFVKDDVRIKQCTRVTMDQLFTAHHELGHIQYYLQYQHQPSIYRAGANPGFHEAVGDVLSLSVSTPKHLEKIGLLKDYNLDEESKINYLFTVALHKIIFLPFAYTIDKYRWGVFRGDIKPNEYNCKFWKLREEYSGIVPPIQRYESDFDAAAKYHVSADVEYLRYLVSFIVQFQFYKSLCEKANQYVPNDPIKVLSNCDIYQSAEAGNTLKAMLEMGSSKPWPDAIEVVTGQRKMDASAILEYFKPLNDWLDIYIKENNIHIGWDKTYQCSVKTTVKPEQQPTNPLRNLNRSKRSINGLPSDARKIIVHNMRHFDVYGSKSGAYKVIHESNIAEKIAGLDGKNVVHGIIGDKFFKQNYNIYLKIENGNCITEYYALKDGETTANKINGLPDDAKLLSMHNLAGALFFGSSNGAYELEQGDLNASKISHVNGNVVHIKLKGSPNRYDADFLTSDSVSKCKYDLESQNFEEKLNKYKNETMTYYQEQLNILKKRLTDQKNKCVIVDEQIRLLELREVKMMYNSLEKDLFSRSVDERIKKLEEKVNMNNRTNEALSNLINVDKF